RGRCRGARRRVRPARRRSRRTRRPRRRARAPAARPRRAGDRAPHGRPARSGRYRLPGRCPAVCSPLVDIAAHLDLALELADLADAITMARFRANDLQVTTKPDLTPVSEADHAVERAIRERLRETGHAVLGE